VFDFRTFCFIRRPFILLFVDSRNILSALLFESAVLEPKLHSQVLPFRLGGLAHRPYELQAKENLVGFFVHKTAMRDLITKPIDPGFLMHAIEF